MPELRYSERPELIAAQETPRLTRGPLAPAVFLRMMLDAVVAIGTLAATAVYFGVRIDGPYIILSLLVFSLTFPGHPPRGTSPGAIARDVLTGWIFIVGLLLMLGWATRTLGSFDERVIVMWIAFTPLALFAGHMLMPVLLPRLLAAEGIQRVAVIAGAGGLGRKLAEQIENTPFLGVRVAGFFDDRSADRLQLGERRALGSVDQLAEYS
jgi:putative colanic acid biosynthesis UDP-glucose lipid carrier transferase